MAEQAALKLEDVFDSSSPTKAGEQPSPEVKAEETKPEEKPQVEEKAKAEEKPKAEAKETPQEKKEAKKEEKPAEVKEEKREEAPKTDWESGENPYRKRYEDTRNWATQINRDNVTLKQQLAIINKKLDGTYDPEKDEPKALSPEDMQQLGEITGKTKASRDAAVLIYGKEAVDKAIKDFDSKFKLDENPIIHYRILSSNSPVIEAMKILKEMEFIERHGSDPLKIEENIRKMVLEAETPKIYEQASKEIMARLSKKEAQAQTLTEVRGAGLEATPKGGGPTPLTQIFPHH